MADQYLQPFFDTLSQGVQVAQQLKQAAIQQAQFNRDDAFRNRQQDLREQEAQMSAIQSGAKPVDAAGNTSYAPRPSVSMTLDPSTQTPVTPQPAAPVAPSEPPPTPVGGNPVMPWSPEAQTAPPPQQPPGRRLFDASTLAQSPNMGTAPDIQQTVPSTGLQLNPGTSAPPQGFAADAKRTYSVGNQKFEDPTWAEKLQRTTDQWNAQKYPTEEGVDIGDELAKAAHLPKGTKIPPSKLGQLGPLIKQMAPAGESYDDYTDKNGVVTRLFSDEKGNPTRKVSLGSIGKSSRAAGGGAGDGSEEKPITATAKAAEAQKALTDYDTFNKLKAKLENENDLLDVAIKNGVQRVDAKGNLVNYDKPGEHATPAQRKGFIEEMQARKTANLRQLPQVISDMQGAQNRYADFSGKESARPTNPDGSRIGGPQPKPTKRATMANIQAYAAKKKITPQQAQKEFEGSGYQINQ